MQPITYNKLGRKNERIKMDEGQWERKTKTYKKEEQREVEMKDVKY